MFGPDALPSRLPVPYFNAALTLHVSSASGWKLPLCRRCYPLPPVRPLLHDQVVWASRSSMEVLIELSHQAPGAPEGSWNSIGLAYFVLVSRSTDRTAAAEVPGLEPQTDREHELFEQGQVGAEDGGVRDGGGDSLDQPPTNPSPHT